MTIAKFGEQEKLVDSFSDSIGRLDSINAIESLGIQSDDPSRKSLENPDSVSIYLDMDAKVNWRGHIQPGAMRRVISEKSPIQIQ